MQFAPGVLEKVREEDISSEAGNAIAYLKIIGIGGSSGLVDWAIRKARLAANGVRNISQPLFKFINEVSWYSGSMANAALAAIGEYDIRLRQAGLAPVLNYDPHWEGSFEFEIFSPERQHFGRIPCTILEIGQQVSVVVVGVQGTKAKTEQALEAKGRRRWANRAIEAMSAFPDNSIGCYMANPDQCTHSTMAVVAKSQDWREIANWYAKNGIAVSMEEIERVRETRGLQADIQTPRGRYRLGKDGDGRTMIITGKAPLPYSIYRAHFDTSNERKAPGLDADFMITNPARGFAHSCTVAPLRMKK